VQDAHRCTHQCFRLGGEGYSRSQWNDSYDFSLSRTGFCGIASHPTATFHKNGKPLRRHRLALDKEHPTQPAFPERVVETLKSEIRNGHQQHD
jgi:hypothetical protein